MSKAIYEEIIEEIGTQSLARLGLNIFSFSSYAAYGASVDMTDNTIRSYNQHKNNQNYHGQAFEELTVGEKNIKNSFLNTGKKTYTTDTLYDIQNTQEILKSGKKFENLSPKDRDKFEFIISHFGDEVNNLDFSQGDLKELIQLSAKYSQNLKGGLKNHTVTDTVTLNKEGKIVNKSQLKVIKDTKGLLKERYFENDEILIPYEDYAKHKENLESIIKEGKNSKDPEKQDEAKRAKEALEKLSANKAVGRWRFLSENPRATAVVTQTAVATTHMVQTGISDAFVASLSTLANGIIWEIKDMYNSKTDSEISVMARIRRLLQKVVDSFKTNFKRGASFGAIDAIVGIIGQIFKNIVGSLKQLWNGIRNSAKSIFNAIYSYIKGEIKDTKDLLKTIIKALLSAVWVVGIVALEKKLELELTPFFGIFASFLSAIFAIVAGAFAVVMTSRSIDLALDTLFAVFAEKEKARLRAEEIANIIAEKLPNIIERREELEAIILKTHNMRIMSLSSSFADYQNAIKNKNNKEIYEALNSINKLYGKELQIKDIEDVKVILSNKNRTGNLQW